jgi:SAM-dependent methyltransferase
MISLAGRAQQFEFGANWADFAQYIDEQRILIAERCLRDLIGGDLSGRSFLDIGCGSGLSALAALRMGATPVHALDIDENSGATTRDLLGEHARKAAWQASIRSVFDLDPERDGQYDVVHSWGVLHHTGDMDRAIRKSAALVKPGGRLVLAVYQRTPFCSFWRWEKRIYSRAPAFMAAVMCAAYKSAFMTGLLLVGRSPATYISDYQRSRGMRWSNDVHDWLGGYPYESASVPQIDGLMRELGFARQNLITCSVRVGLFGTGCNQYVYRRPAEM